MTATLIRTFTSSRLKMAHSRSAMTTAASMSASLSFDETETLEMSVTSKEHFGVGIFIGSKVFRIATMLVAREGMSAKTA